MAMIARADATRDDRQQTGRSLEKEHPTSGLPAHIVVTCNRYNCNL